MEQQISDIHLNKMKLSAENTAAIFENIRSTALSIYEQYLGEKSEQRVLIKPALAQTLHFKIRNLNETPSELWFDKVLEVVYERMAVEFLPSFKKSKAYIKLLQELDLLQQVNAEEDSISLNSNESLENNENQIHHISKRDFLSLDGGHKSVKHVRSLSDVTTFTGKSNGETKIRSSSQEKRPLKYNIDPTEAEEKVEDDLKTGDYKLSVNIIETGEFTTLCSGNLCC